jgi:hypothetical protein
MTAKGNEPRGMDSTQWRLWAENQPALAQWIENYERDHPPPTINKRAGGDGQQVGGDGPQGGGKKAGVDGPQGGGKKAGVDGPQGDGP